MILRRQRKGEQAQPCPSQASWWSSYIINHSPLLLLLWSMQRYWSHDPRDNSHVSWSRDGPEEITCPRRRRYRKSRYQKYTKIHGEEDTDIVNGLQKESKRIHDAAEGRYVCGLRGRYVRYGSHMMIDWVCVWSYDIMYRRRKMGHKSLISYQQITLCWKRRRNTEMKRHQEDFHPSN